VKMCGMKSFAYPGNIEADILSIGAEQIPYMRTEWFSGMMLECQSLLLELLDCPGGGVIPYTASGTAAMESCVRSFAATRKKALVVNGGTFGARWAELCGYSGIPRDVFDVDFGKAPCWERLIQAIASGDYGTLLIQHHETSSGYLYDLSRLSDACRDHDVALVVDAISSFLTDPLSMRDLHIDILVLSSQKGLNLPPGLSFVVLSDRVLAKNSFAPGGYYYDWDTHLRNMKRGQTPYSPATQLFRQLHARLKKLEKSGVERAIDAVKTRAIAFRAACQENGWRLSADERSNCLTGIYLDRPVKPLVRQLQDMGIFVMPCQHENMIRVAHTGCLTVADDLELAEEIARWEKTANA